jgi:holo-[acyl-carrier protein] synthase
VIVGIGVDVVDIARFDRAVGRTPALLPRLFTEGERHRPTASLAARFAAKEALIKAIGETRAGFRWVDMVVDADEHGNPHITAGGGVAEMLAERGITDLHLSMTHDCGVACAFVVAERLP